MKPYKIRVAEPKRRVPRPFKFPFGKGVVVEEASVICPHWEPVIQLLRFDEGEMALRFCVYSGNRFTRMPLILGEKEIKALARVVRKRRGIRKLLERMVRPGP